MERMRLAPGWTAFALAALALAVHAEGADIPVKKAPPLPPPAGRVVNVGDVDGFRKAVVNAKDGDTIVLAEGTYRCVPYVWMRDKKNVTIRGATSDPAKVKLTGKGWAEGGDHTDEDIFWLDSSENITFADLTFAETHAYGLKINAEGRPQNIKVWNCHFRDIGIRGIKGTGGDSRTGFVKGGEVRYCWFENTKIPPGDWQFNGDYITSIDMMRLDGWVFADNVFKNIKGKNGQARGAIFVWVESKNVTAERNVFIDCDRGVCFGNASNGNGGEKHIRDSICRNNFFVSSNFDAMVEVSWAENVKVYNNTVVKTGPKDHNNRGIRVISNSGNKDVEIANNIVAGGGIEKDNAREHDNYTGAVDGYFIDVASGDLRLTPSAVNAINKGVALEQVKEDFDGGARDPNCDLGASEFGAKPKAETAVASAASSGKPAPKKDAPPPPPAPKAIDPAPHREAIAQALQAPGTKFGKSYLKIFGKDMDVVVKGADASGLTVMVMGNAMPLRWKDLSDDDFTQLGWSLFGENAQVLVHAGALAASTGKDSLREKISLRLAELSPALAKDLDKIAGR
ncbi:MAG: hypothetical protein KIS92_22495 [Planctomycetota bacterium]|nr:hypothetical protein [Planctomycetota bacterium]